MSDVPEKVERVARALWEASPQISEATKRDERIYAEYKHLFETAARAAIAAMREPTEAMCDQVTMGYAGPDEHGGLAVTRSAAQTIWRKMIDAALTGSPCPSASAVRPPTSEP